MTPKQREFCRHYVKLGSAEKAALAAGYAEKYARAKSHKILEAPDVIDEIKRLRARLNEQADKSATDVVNEYSKIAFADRVDFLKEDPDRPGEFIYKSPDELTADQRSIVEKVTYTSVEIVVIEDGEPQNVWRKHYNYVLADKANALQQMGRHFGIFDDKLKLTGNSQNPFKNATPEQLAQLKRSAIGIMSGGQVIDGEYEEQNMLPNGQGRTGTRG